MSQPYKQYLVLKVLNSKTVHYFIKLLIKQLLQWIVQGGAHSTFLKTI
jgi:hypothetical protein